MLQFFVEQVFEKGLACQAPIECHLLVLMAATLQCA